MISGNIAGVRRYTHLPASGVHSTSAKPRQPHRGWDSSLRVSSHPRRRSQPQSGMVQEWKTNRDKWVHYLRCCWHETLEEVTILSLFRFVKICNRIWNWFSMIVFNKALWRDEYHFLVSLDFFSHIAAPICYVAWYLPTTHLTSVDNDAKNVINIDNP